MAINTTETNLLTILFEPFSLRRFLAFALCAVLAFLGAQSEIPTAVGSCFVGPTNCDRTPNPHRNPALSAPRRPPLCAPPAPKRATAAPN